MIRGNWNVKTGTERQSTYSASPTFFICWMGSFPRAVINANQKYEMLPVWNLLTSCEGFLHPEVGWDIKIWSASYYSTIEQEMRLNLTQACQAWLAASLLLNWTVSVGHTCQFFGSYASHRTYNLVPRMWVVSAFERRFRSWSGTTKNDAITEACERNQGRAVILRAFATMRTHEVHLVCRIYTS